MIPKACGMPELKVPPFDLLAHSILQDQFVGNPRLSDRAILCRRNYVRLVQKAARHYTTGRNLILAQIHEQKRPLTELMKGRLIYLFRFADEVEDCLLVCRRLLRFFDLLKAEPTISSRIDRTARRLLEAKKKSVRDFRDRIEHMADQIAKQKFPVGSPLSPDLTEDGTTVSVGGVSLSLSQLGSFIETLQEVGVSLFGDVP